MIPKGAIICIVLGIVGAGVVGDYFSNIANQAPSLTYVQGPSLSIITEKINFHLGDPIKIRIINSGTIPLTFSDSSYGMKIVQLDGLVLYSPTSVQMISVLEPKEEKIFDWNQTKSDGSKIIEGRYKIVSSATAGQDLLEKSIIINIFK